jgi:hypothetical protein
LINILNKYIYLFFFVFNNIFFLLAVRNGFPAIPNPAPIDFKPPKRILSLEEKKNF